MRWIATVAVTVAVTAAVIGAVIGAVIACQRPPAGDAARVLDSFDDVAAWQATGSEGASAAVRRGDGVHGGALRLAFDLGATAGYAVARRALPLDLAGDFELGFSLRGEAPINNLEIKLVDASGDNVWWYHRQDVAIPRAWRDVIIPRRQIEFAWGPAADHTLHKIAAIEVVVSAGRDGGRGWIELDDLTLRARTPSDGPPRAVASSAVTESEGARAIDGDPRTAWRSDPAATGPAQLTVDLGREHDVGGVIAQWAAPPGPYTIALSRDGARWQAAGAGTGAGGVEPIWIGELAARFVRVTVATPPAAGAQLAELAAIDTGNAVTADAAASAFVEQLARRAPRGSFPRGFSGEQAYWTVVGVDGGGGHASLLSEDGAIELASGAALEPFVQTARGTTSWATAEQITQALDDDYLPIPSVTWQTADWQLTITALALGDAAHTQLAVRYALHNRTHSALTARLALAVRPLQVNPPRQFLNRAGGVRRIGRLAWAHGALALDDSPALAPLAPPDRIAFSPLAALATPLAALAPAAPSASPQSASTQSASPQSASSQSASPQSPSPQSTPPQSAPPQSASLQPSPPQSPPSHSAAPSPLADPTGFASAALAYDLALPADGDATIVVTAPLTVDAPDAPGPPAPADPAAWFADQLAAARAAWHAKLDRVGFRVPADGAPLIATLRASLAYMLITRDGAILRPGTRSYARAWIRDGAMIGEALLRLGHPDVAADFLRWYLPFQSASGKVPCCVDPHGAGPVPEHDAHGELIHLAAEIARLTGDRAALADAWPHVLAAAHYLDELRATQRTPATPATVFGLLPPSISHEGYSAKPAYAYWDDFWALTGYRDAVWIATALGHPDDAARLAAARDQFTHDLLASLTATTAAHHIDFIPGAADLGDFDATSTTIALSPAGAQADLPAPLLTATFDRAWRDLQTRATRPTWDAYTPYELRLVGAFVRLGQPARARALLTAYLADQRPRAWHQWAEVVGREPRTPRFIGDMPHAWVHSDYARSVLDLFAYERAADHAIVLAAGVPPAWRAHDGFAIDRLPTSIGPLSYRVTVDDRGTATLELPAGATPPGGFVISPGSLAPLGDREIHISHRPATVVLSRSGDLKHL
ncbi:MAG TPA: discoidin domain-containing protein [Kofleriaceae bacterium]|nr:discoidin domain-containing protein [Kofleriaceae bacterium]